MEKICNPEAAAYSIPGVMSVLGVSRQTIYNAIAEGKLTSFRIGNRRLVSKHALEDFIRKAEMESRA